MFPKRKMDFFMEVHQLRDELKPLYPSGIHTLELIRAGRRQATTRSQALGSVGNLVVLYHSQKPGLGEVLVRVIEHRKVRIETAADAESWSQLEGWSVDFLKSHTELNGQIQTTFEVVNPEQHAS